MYTDSTFHLSPSLIECVRHRFRVRCLSCMCKTAAMFLAIEILVLPPYTTVVPFLYISHFPDLELSRFRVIGTASTSRKYDKRCN